MKICLLNTNGLENVLTFTYEKLPLEIMTCVKPHFTYKVTCLVKQECHISLRKNRVKFTKRIATVCPNKFGVG